MRHLLSIAGLIAITLTASVAQAGVQTGQVATRDRDRQIVVLTDGTSYFVPQRAYMRDFRPRRRVTIWYSMRDGVRVVVNHKVQRQRD